MRLKQHLSKRVMVTLILGPLVMTSCDDDGDDDNEPQENQEANKPPKGQSNMSSEEQDIYRVIRQFPDYLKKHITRRP